MLNFLVVCIPLWVLLLLLFIRWNANLHVEAPEPARSSTRDLTGEYIPPKRDDDGIPPPNPFDYYGM